MKNKIHQMNDVAKKKELYVAPKIDMLPLELEYGIAVSSAIVRPPDSPGDIKTEWEVGTDRQTDMEW